MSYTSIIALAFRKTRAQPMGKWTQISHTRLLNVSTIFMTRNLNALSFAGSFAVLMVCLVAAPCFGQTGNEMLDGLINNGFEVVPGNVVRLPPPLVNDSMDAAAQAKAIQDIAKAKGEERFYKNSRTSPFVLEMESKAKLANGDKISTIDVWFIAYGTLEKIEGNNLLEDLARGNPKAKPGIPEEGRSLTEEELNRAKLEEGKQADGSQLSYAVTQANLLDKAHLTLLTLSQGIRKESTMSLATRLDSEIATALDMESKWRPIEKNASREYVLGDPETPYYGAASYLHVTELKNVPNALLVELHVAFLEPKGWFQGRNLLRSKLPILIQDSVRTFRSKLNQ